MPYVVFIVYFFFRGYEFDGEIFIRVSSIYWK